MTKGVIFGKTSSQLNAPRYARKGAPATDINHLLNLPPSKAISYFKVYRRTRGGSGLQEQYWKTLDNGYMIYVDVGSIKMGVVMGMPAIASFTACTKREYEEAKKKVLKALDV